MISPPTLGMPLIPGRHNKQRWSVQLSVDFDEARGRGHWNHIWDLMLLRSSDLLAFDDVAAGRRILGQSDLGLRVIPVDAIVGSLGRSNDFDHAFMPRHAHLKSRWLAVNQAYYTGEPLPPVELLQLGKGYFVIDGHHRISVASFHGQHYVEAHVIQVHLQAAQHRCEKSMEVTCVVHPSLS